MHGKLHCLLEILPNFPSTPDQVLKALSWVHVAHICPRASQQMSTRCHTATHLLDVQQRRHVLISFWILLPVLVPGCVQWSGVECIVELFCYHFQHVG